MGGDGPPGLLIVNPDLNARPVRLESADPLPGGQAAEEGFVLASAASVPPLGILTGRPAPAAGVKVVPAVAAVRPVMPCVLKRLLKLRRSFDSSKCGSLRML